MHIFPRVEVLCEIQISLNLNLGRHDDNHYITRTSIYICLVCKFELPRPENPASTVCDIKEPLDSCFDLIRSHQLYIP